MKLKLVSIAFAAALALSTIGLAGAGNAYGKTKITICHQTSSESNPQVVITVGRPAGKGHLHAKNGNHPHTHPSGVVDSLGECAGEPGGDDGAG